LQLCFELRFQRDKAGTGLFSQIFINATLLASACRKFALLYRLCFKQRGQLGFARLVHLSLLQVLCEVSHLLLQFKQPLAGVIRQDEWAGLEIGV